ncbi:hypothetical protein HAALTHF_54300n [Vreelandella aquamarina]|nr:hypothetical protein HAALTHF_54300n [Halomonas axialensis]
MWDFIIVGGGILGFSTAMQLQQAYPDKRLLVLERKQAPLSIKPAITAA